MKNIISKFESLFLLSIFVTIFFMPIELRASENDLFSLPNNYGETISLSGMHGKPPYNRSKIKAQRKNKQRLVEMSALEVEQNSSDPLSSKVSKKRHARLGHPDSSKR